MAVTLLLVLSGSATAWTQVVSPPGLDVRSYAQSLDGSIKFVAMDRGGFWKSSDNGQTWHPMNSVILPEEQLSISRANEVRILDEAADTVLVKYKREGGTDSTPSQFSISTDGGDSWAIVDPENATDANYFQHLLISCGS